MSSIERWHRAARATLLAFAAALPFAVEAKCGLTQIEIPVQIVEHRPIATLGLNGTQVPFLLDSGAFFSILHENVAKELSLKLSAAPHGLAVYGFTGKVSMRVTRVERVELIGANLFDIEFLVGGSALPGFRGILGRNVLSIADAEYELANGAVRLSFPKGDCEETNFAHWAGSAPVMVSPFRWSKARDDTTITAQVRINGVAAEALLDTGAATSTMTRALARKAGIDDALKLVGRARGLGEGSTPVWLAPGVLFELAGERVANAQFTVADPSDGTSDVDVILGLDYFLSHRIYVSRLQRKLYITWNGSPVFSPPRPGSSASDALTTLDRPPLDEPDALVRRANATLAARNPRDALADLDRACTLAPTLADCFEARARTKFALNDDAGALADWDETIRLDPSLAQARLRRASMRVHAGRLDEGADDLRQLDATLPATSPLRLTMGELYAAMGRSAEAAHQFDTWIEQHPNDNALASAYNSRCWLRAGRNVELLRGLADCQAAIRREPEAANYHDSLGWMQLRMGDAENARRAFDRAIELKPSAASFLGRSIAQRRLGRADQSAEDLAAARRLRPKVVTDLVKDGFEFVREVAP